MNSKPRSGLALAARYAVPFGLLAIVIWMTQVNKVVPEPYLDEAFHIPQAQAYWDHNWTYWDPKITTPPGLYIFSYAVCALILLLRGTPEQLDPPALRATNAAAAAVLLPLRLQTALDTLRRQRNTRPSGAWLSHTVLNICLFPPLFFFSGLYYTDVLALLVVIEAYNWDLSRTRKRSAPLETAVFLIFGVVALAFRQTNIFWVSVFFGGLRVVRTIRFNTKTCESSDVAAIVAAGSKNELYDPFVLDASFADYFKTAISLCSVALNNLGSVVTSLIPYLLILAAFGGFVLWNGSVVLGHKEFHTASLHLAQMLYIWPYFLFFSWPLLLAPLANIVLPKFMLPKFLDQGFPASRRQLPKILTALLVLPVMLAVVHFNTIVHPFTLADNRHYVFYVFRLLLNSHPYTRYAATIVYFLGAWMIISAMGYSPVTSPPRVASVAKNQPPAAPSSSSSQKPEQKDQKKSEKKQKAPKKPAAAAAAPEPIDPKVWADLQEHIKRRQRQEHESFCVSFVLVWLAATALSLVTAPLVEPRYLIIPWVMWRLHLPPSPTPVVYRRAGDEKDLEARTAINFPLFLETGWFLLVNVLTGCLFLHDRPAKRPKLSPNPAPNRPQTSSTSNLASLHRSITPPPSRPGRVSVHVPIPASASPHRRSEISKDNSNNIDTTPSPRLIPSPIQLTRIRDFSDSLKNNGDTARLRDILGDPLIRECWQFNYLFDVDFLLRQFDEDVRRLVKVRVVHGSWKSESDNRVRIDEACQRYKNLGMDIEPIIAYMPEPFGTHHSKMMILLRHDDSAQVVIHTANMIPGDWANMCQAVWRSPLLPLGPNTKGPEGERSTAWGSGARFKRDLLAYLKAYGIKKTGPLVEGLAKYDFSAVRAALIASVPSKENISASSNGNGKTLWGWPALRDALQNVPLSERDSKTTPHIVTQMSSIATLGQTDKWLKDVFFDALAPSRPTSPSTKRRPKFSIIFPTAEEIRRSLNGYGSGGSIHMKLQSAAQQKQLQYLRPYLRHWAGDVADADRLPRGVQDAGRRRAAPHIKTYIRFTDAQSMDRIDWALVTSANLSTQAWGAAANPSGEVRICSWEVGVLVWPELFAEQQRQGQPHSMAMVPCFKKDRPVYPWNVADATGPSALVGFRMPYDLPLTSYGAQDVPWCATMEHLEPDWLGQTWTA
ncbi:dolichyl-P-Glc:Glc(2)Man(9)GlcNAc(2)-PP-dolichol alpha-1,2- glucosyltransferase [Aspergillus undulatus]|uniref:dolichyl-P-Glc:Glc(2)Man(9)GlcNAc(2)-PP-dolichol alpha-1,2- glucosyltransferase n=1 Tax=Aspergillus undulatus TaxID=1810928 RepID=UPI003CCDD330